MRQVASSTCYVTFGDRPLLAIRTGRINFVPRSAVPANLGQIGGVRVKSPPALLLPTSSAILL